MTNFKIKSDENLEAGQILIDQAKFNASVHCLYYSCFLLLLHILKKEPSKSQEYGANSSAEDGSHNQLLNWFYSDISKLSLDDAQDFKVWIEALKKARKKADYYEDIITEAQAKNAKTIASYVIELLKNIYSL